MEKKSFTWNEAIQKMNLQKLGLTETEIAEVLKADKAIDKGEKLFELSKEQEQASKKARQADRTPTVYKFQKRERKADNAKRELMELLQKAITEVAEDVEVTNAEREMIFHFSGKKYKIVLSAPRS